MLALSNSGQRTVFLIDEIFRGTNHLESVSAGAAVLHALAENDIVLVSSHNLVLGTLLEDRLAALCVQSDDEGKLRLEPGILRQTNGIALLRHGGFDPAIEAHAQRIHAALLDSAAA
jgi:DNA mismatch repair ATPase MutS